MDSLGSVAHSEAEAEEEEEEEEEAFSDCCSVLSAEEIGTTTTTTTTKTPAGRGQQVPRPRTPRAHGLPPRAPHAKEPFRRLTPKRPAPQPPSRPPPPTTPLPSLSPGSPPGSADPAPMASAIGTPAVPCTAAVPDTALAPVTVHQETPPSSEPAEPAHAFGASCDPVQPLPEAEGSPPDPRRTPPSQPMADPQVVTHARSLFLPRPMSPPRSPAGGGEGAAPPTPQRSSASQMAARNFSTRMIRLIDDESDSDAYQSDTYEERFVFQAQPPAPRRPLQAVTSSPRAVVAPPLRVVTPGAPEKPLAPQTRLVMTSPLQVMAGPAQSVTSASQVMALPAQVVPPTQVVTQVIASPAQQLLGPMQQSVVVKQAVAGAMPTPVRSGDAGDENVYEFYGNLTESLTTEAEGSMMARRGGGVPLTHSASAPAVLRPLRPLRRGLASPPPLDHLSEEEEEVEEAVASSDYEDYEQIPRPALLQRTDSLVTVAHLYEDLLVSSRFRLRVTLTNLTAVVVMAALVVPNTSTILYTAFRLVFGTLFPAYYSYKAVKTKNVKEYVKWMMYWIVFAFFTCFETLTDLFLSFWFPFYYELKILVVLWLLSPATRGSSILYRKFVHPWLTRREDDIDNCIAQAKQQGYSTVIQLGTKGVNYATTVLMQTAIKGGGGLVNQLRRSYSSGELADGDMNRNVKALPHIPDDDYDDHTHSSGSYETEPRTRAESDAAYKPRGSSASRVVRSNKTRSADVSDVYYQDVPDETIQRRRSPRSQDTASRVLSADDLTSGYSSGDPDAGDLIYDLRHDPCPDTEPEEISEPKRSTRVRRTQSLSASTLSLHRSLRAGVRKVEGRGGLRSGNAGRGSGPVDDMGAPASYSSSGHPAAPHHGSSFKRSRPGEISAYATLPRTTSKRATTKKRQV